MIREITLINRDLKKAKAEVTDARDAAILWEEYGPKLDWGGYEKTEDADIIIYTAGSSKVTSDRMEMLHSNCVIEDIHEIIMTKEERDAFLASVDTIRQAAISEGIIG